MTHFQFTSPNAAGAKDNQAMLTALREALKEVQEVESKVINAAPAIAEVEGDAIQSQAEQEASQMRSQAIGSIVGGASGMLSAGLEVANMRASAPSTNLIEEAQYHETCANALEDGTSLDNEPTTEVHTDVGNTEDQARVDQGKTAEQVQAEKNAKSEAAKNDIHKRFGQAAERAELKKTARIRQATGEQEDQEISHEDAVKKDLQELRQKSGEMTPKHRAEMVNRFRRSADTLRARANNMDAVSQRRSGLTQGLSQIGQATGSAGGGFAGAVAKGQAGVDQRQAEMSRLLAQGQQKTQDNSSGQTKSVADSLQGAVNGMRNYYSSRG